MDTVTDWQEGRLTDVQALRALTSEYGEVESSIAPLEAERQAIRDALSIIVDRLGTTEVPGFGKLTMTNASRTVSYDKQAISDLVMQLVHDGYGDIAQRILACEKQSMRAGSLRIEREKGSK